MASNSGNKSRDGFEWNETSGLQAGIPSLGVVKPDTNFAPSRHTYDVIVIGAGYTGLTAVRDLSTTGHDVLLLEARDRIGGRTWSSNIGGYPFEMGGTWVHWCQPFVYREISRYGMYKELEISPVTTGGINCFSVGGPDGKKSLTHDEEAALMESAMRKFVNVDGKYCRELIPFPHDPHYNPEVAKYDKMSFADRFAEINHDLTPLERVAFEGFLSITSGGTMENSSFFELLRWWSLNNYDMQQFMELCLTFKFRHGQSTFARKFFDESVASGNLKYAFSSPVASVEQGQKGGKVKVTSRSGAVFEAKKVVVTIPLNLLNSVRFDPPIHPGKREASSLGHVNNVVKVHVEAANPELRSFTGLTYPNNKLTYMMGDGTTPAGNTHLVSFGSSIGQNHLQPEEDIKVTINALKEFVPMDVRRVVFHNWFKDEFSQGAWEWLRPGMATKYLDALRQREGNVLFASADWALGWRGFIDGAIEDGARVAMELKTELKEEAKVASKL